VVNITSATNADVDAGASATVISAASQAELLVAFSPGVNQVRCCLKPPIRPAYDPKIPIRPCVGTA